MNFYVLPALSPSWGEGAVKYKELSSLLLGEKAGPLHGPRMTEAVGHPLEAQPQ